MSPDLDEAESKAPSEAYALARRSFEARRWAETVKLAARVLSHEPEHAGAFELLSAARRQLDRKSARAGEQRILSVLMCDLVDSARLSQRIGREAYRNLLQDVQELCAAAVARYEGRIAQYLGDGVLAYFSYPQAHEDDPLRAALAALAIVSGVRAVRLRKAHSANVEVAVRIGIDLGVVMVATMGGGDWTTTDSIVGDPPNFAARLQAIAPRNGIIASASAYERVAPYVRARPVRARRFKGFDGRRRTYELLSALSTFDKASLTLHHGPLIGRERERLQLEAAWQRALDGQRQVVVLIGDAGMGKTRLADELVAFVQDSGNYLVVRCSALHKHVPFYPLAVALRHWLGVSRAAGAISAPDLCERLAGMGLATAQPLAELLGAPLDDTRLPEQRRERMLQALIALLEVLAAKQPFLLVIEDVHDADMSTLELAQRVCTTVKRPFAVLATSRPHVDAIARLPGATAIDVGPLSDDACQTLAARILGTRARAALVELVVARACGSPLFAKELATWLDRGHPPNGMPPALDLLLTARIDGVKPELRDLVITASVIGAEFEVEDLVELSGQTATAIELGLAHLIVDGILELDPERGETRRFRHALFRDAAYRRLPPSTASRKHLRLAEIYEARRRAGRCVPAAVIARHWNDGGALGRAREAWHEAALEARATAAHAEAMQHYEAAIALLPTIESPAERAGAALPLQLGMAESASMVLGYTAERVLLAFEEANTLTAAMPDSAERFTATMGLHTYTLVTGQLERAEHLLDTALADATTARSHGLEGTARAAQAYARFYRGRLAGARAQCLQAASAVPTIGVPQDPITISRLLLGLIAWLQDDPQTGAQLCTEALHAAKHLAGERAAFTQAFALTHVAWQAHMVGDAVLAKSYASDALALSRTHGFTLWHSASTMHFAVALCELGELATGLALLETELDAWRKSGAGVMVPFFMGRLAAAKLRAHDAAAALELFQGAIARARVNDEQIYLAELYRLRAQCRREQGALVVEDLQRAIAVADALEHRLFARRARADLAEYARGSSGALYVRPGGRAGGPCCT